MAIPNFSDRLTFASRNCLQKAIKYLHKAQQPHGGWIGSWGICFTYAAQFALESLSLVGETYETSEYSRKGCDFLLKYQREDGGWSESWEVRGIHCGSRARDRLFCRIQSCGVLKWVEREESQVVQTAWAVMGLMYAKYPYPEPIERAVKLVMARQLPVCILYDFALELALTFYPYCRMVHGHKKRQRG